MKLGKYGGFIIFNGNIYRAEEIINALLSQHTTEIRFFNDSLVIGNYQIAPLRPTEEDIEQIMDMTCYGSLAYCCSLEKRCEIRDMVLRLLNITPREYENIKKQNHKNFISLAKQKLEYKNVRTSPPTSLQGEDVPTSLKDIQSPTGQTEFKQDSIWKEIREDTNFPFGQLDSDLFDTEETSTNITNSKIPIVKQNRMGIIPKKEILREKTRYDAKIQKNVKICKYCGASIPDYAKFCPACGRPITD